MQQQQEELASKNKKRAILSSPAIKNKGVQVTKSGLQYKVIQKAVVLNPPLPTL